MVLDAIGAVSYICAMTIQDRLRKLKQREAASLLGVSRPFVAQLIKNIRAPSVITIIRAGDSLGCDDAEIVKSVRVWAEAAEARADAAPADSTKPAKVG